jgi:hypothetical protein
MHELDVIDALLYPVFDVAFCIFGFLQLWPESQLFLHVGVCAVSKDDRHWPTHVHRCSEAGRLQIRAVAFHFDLVSQLFDVGILVVQVTDCRDAESHTLW